MNGIKSIFVATLLLLMACGTPAQKTPDPAVPTSRLAIAEAMFQERCKTAGEKIYRTAENVEGIFLMKVRPNGINYGHTPEQQFALDDPYGRDLDGQGYIGTFIRGKYQAETIAPPAPVPGAPPRLGYRYVEAIDPMDGLRYRYTGSMRAIGKKDVTAYNVQVELKRDPNYDLNIYAFVLDKTPAPADSPRYGVTYDDISTHEEREYWIAGSSLKVIDLKSNEVMAERIGYMMDRGQGDNGGGRSPWLLAASTACPAFPVAPGNHPFKMNQTRDFVEKVLHIKQGN